MKITKRQLRRIIKEEVARSTGFDHEAGDLAEADSLPRTHGGKEITPQSVAGELFNLAAKIEALGEDFFSDSDSLAEWVNQFMTKHDIMQ